MRGDVANAKADLKDAEELVTIQLSSLADGTWLSLLEQAQAAIRHQQQIQPEGPQHPSISRRKKFIRSLSSLYRGNSGGVSIIGGSAAESASSSTGDLTTAEKP